MALGPLYSARPFRERLLMLVTRLARIHDSPYRVRYFIHSA